MFQLWVPWVEQKLDIFGKRDWHKSNFKVIAMSEMYQAWAGDINDKIDFENGILPTTINMKDDEVFIGYLPEQFKFSYFVERLRRGDINIRDIKGVDDWVGSAWNKYGGSVVTGLDDKINEMIDLRKKKTQEMKEICEAKEKGAQEESEKQKKEPGKRGGGSGVGRRKQGSGGVDKEERRNRLIRMMMRMRMVRTKGVRMMMRMRMVRAKGVVMVVMRIAKRNMTRLSVAYRQRLMSAITWILMMCNFKLWLSQDQSSLLLEISLRFRPTSRDSFTITIFPLLSVLMQFVFWKGQVHSKSNTPKNFAKFIKNGILKEMHCCIE